MALSLRPLKPEIFPGGTFHLRGGERIVKVGRAPGNELRVEHASVSFYHATLAVDTNATVEVIDSGSSNGTFVNGIRVDRRHLADGDLLRFASAEFRVFAVSADGGNGRHSESDANTDMPESESHSRGFGEVAEPSSSADADSTRSPEPEPDPLLPLSEVEAEKARLLNGFAEEREVLLREIDQLRTAHDTNLQAVQNLRMDLEQRESELRERDDLLRSSEDDIRRLRRDLEEAGQREQRLTAGQSEARREVIEREGIIAGLNYEIQIRDGQLRQLDEQRARLQGVCDEFEIAHTTLTATHAQTTADLVFTQSERDAAQARSADLREKLRILAERLLSDWRAWIPGDAVSEIAEGEGEEGIFGRVGSVADAIRSELDRIEPIWHLYGDGVQAELSRRCDLLRVDQAALEEEIARRREERSALEGDLAHFRELLDLEVRRAQGLSRKGVEIEIPERFEAMTIARDREQEVYRALVERVEVLDLLLEGYRRSRKLREVHHELADFRRRLAAILETGGVHPFEIELGTFLTLKHRREVQILSRKGWGTKQYAEYPFQPGEVIKVVRSGYRVGEGDGAVILRKVEVLIRGVEE